MFAVSRSLLGGLFCVIAVATAAPAHAGQVRVDGDGHVYHPVFSPDGKFVAYEVNRLAGKVDLFLSEVNGNIAKDGVHIALPGGGAFAGGDVVAANPVWHPQGIVVFEGSNPGGQYRLYYHQPGGGTAAEMITTTDMPGHITFPAVAADGTKLAMVAKNTGNGDVYIRDSNTGALEQVTKTPGTESFPLFAPDVTEILFTRKHADTEDVFTIRLSDGMETPIVTGPGDQSRPVYARNGERILYFDGARGEGQWDLMSVDSKGGDAKRIAKSVRLPHRGRPAISADGEWVAYGWDNPQEATKISISKVDGSQTVNIDTKNTACGEPALSVNNGRVILAYTSLPNSGAEWRFLTIEDITDQLH